jgi:hypothetical protein
VLIFARTKAEAVTVAEIMQKDDSKSQARTAADSSTGHENNSVSQHNAKPLVVGLPSLSDDTSVSLIKIDSAGSFGKNNPYSMLTFEVNGKKEKHGLSDGKLLSLIKEAESKCSIPGVVRHKTQTHPTYALSVQQ